MSDLAVEALHRLVNAAQCQEFQDVLRSLDVQVLTAFGSAALLFEGREGRPSFANNLDIGVLFRDQSRLFELINVLVSVAGYDQLDIAVIDREHPVLDAEAMCGLPIFEDSPGRYAREQMAAFGRRRDTAYLRQLDLELMAR